jgi:hypothetical protein
MIRRELADRLVKEARRAGMRTGIDLLLAEARECAYIRRSKRSGARDEKAGASHVGGWPDLPKDVEWPAGLDEKRKPHGHARFLAQINLADVPQVEGVPLPRRGHLWVFLRSLESYAAMRPVVLVHPGGVKLAPRRPPSGKLGYGLDERAGAPPWHLNAGRDVVALRFERGISLPYRESFWSALITAERPRLAGKEPGEIWSDAAHQTVLRAISTVDDIDGRDGQVGGYSGQESEDLYRAMAFGAMGRAECQYADGWESAEAYEKALKRLRGPHSRDIFADALKKRPWVKWIDRHREQIAAEAATWQLLFEFRSSLMDFGEAMYFDVFIRWADLAAGRFDAVEGAGRSIT